MGEDAGVGEEGRGAAGVEEGGTPGVGRSRCGGGRRGQRRSVRAGASPREQLRRGAPASGLGGGGTDEQLVATASWGAWLGRATPRAARKGVAASVSLPPERGRTVWSGLSDVGQVDKDKLRASE